MTDPYETLTYEDELPEDITDEEYDDWYSKSWVDGVRMGPKVKRSADPYETRRPKEYWANMQEAALDAQGLDWVWWIDRVMERECEGMDNAKSDDGGEVMTIFTPKGQVGKIEKALCANCRNDTFEANITLTSKDSSKIKSIKCALCGEVTIFTPAPPEEFN